MNVEKVKVNGSAAAMPLFKASEQPKPATGKVRVTMIVSPEQAAKWLEGNTSNRNLRRSLVTQYAKDMTAGRWKNAEDCIIFDGQMRLIDGQHRLHACVQSGSSFEVDVVFNADMEIQKFKDIGGVRGSADVAHLAGIPNSIRVASLARLVLIHREQGIGTFTNHRLHPTKTQVNEEVLNNKRLQDAVLTGCKLLTAPSVIDFCNYTFREQDEAQAKMFMTDVLTGDGIAKGEPAYALRERLNDNARNRAKLPVHMIIALFFKAWKYYRDGKQLKCLRWSSGEEFPEI